MNNGSASIGGLVKFNPLIGRELGPEMVVKLPPLPIIEPVPFWERSVQPGYALAFIGACAAFGFLAGVSIAAYLSKKLWDGVSF